LPLKINESLSKFPYNIKQLLGENLTNQLKEKFEAVKSSSSIDEEILDLLEYRRKEIADYVFFSKQIIQSHPIITDEVFNRFKQNAAAISAGIRDI